MRKEYVPAYAEHLRQLAAGQGPQRIERLPAPVVEMDRQLPEQTILMFRWESRGRVAQIVLMNVWPVVEVTSSCRGQRF